jgi:hypothetical protein
MKEVIDKTKRNAVMQKTIAVTSPAGDKRSVALKITYAWRDNEVPKVLAFDAGHVLNAFGLAMGHVDEEGRFAYDAFVEVRPRANMSVSHTLVYKRVIKPLIEKYNVVAIASDRWQNIKMADDIQDEFRIPYLPKRLLYGDFQAWREAVYHKELTIPRPEIPLEKVIDVEQTDELFLDDRPAAQFIRQCIRVVDEPGKTVEKPSSGNDDVFRAGVVAWSAAQVPEIARLLRASRMQRNAPDGIGVNAVGTMAAGTIRASDQVAAIGTMAGMRVIPLTHAPVIRPPLIAERREQRSADGHSRIRVDVPPKKKNKRR